MKERCTAPETGTLLHAFELGILEESQTEEFEQHLLACSFCYEQVREFETEADLIRSDTELLQVLDQPGVDRESSIWRRLWPKGPVVFRPAIAYGVAAVLFLALIGSWWNSVDRIRPVQSVVLAPVRSAVSATFDSSQKQDLLMTFLFRGARPGEEYIVRIVDGNGLAVYEDKKFDNFDEHETGRLLLPNGVLSRGRYIVNIEESGDGDRSAAQEYHLVVQ